MMRRGLHDLAQPMTALQCRLWLGTVEEPGEGGFQVAMEESLRECERMIGSLRQLQDQVEAALSREGI